MTLLKPTVFWVLLLSAHGCVLSSDLEMEARLHADNVRILAEYQRENGHE